MFCYKKNTFSLSILTDIGLKNKSPKVIDKFITISLIKQLKKIMETI